MIHENATDCRFVVFSEQDRKRTNHATVNTARGARSTLTRRLKAGKITAPSYGWERQELVGGEWIVC